MIYAAIYLIFPLCMAVAAFSDLFTMTIPNRVSIILLGSFVLIAPPRRADRDRLKDSGLQLEAESGRINGRYAELDWTPIRYIHRQYERPVLAALFHA